MPDDKYVTVISTVWYSVGFVKYMLYNRAPFYWHCSTEIHYGMDKKLDPLYYVGCNYSSVS